MPFATGIPSPVDLKVGSDGSLYYLARGSGASTGVVYRISYTASAPSITPHPASQTVAPGASVTFSVRASGPPPIRYQWQRNGANISGATAQDYTFVAAAADNGAGFRAIVSNDSGNVLSNDGDADGHRRTSRPRHDHPAGGRDAVQRRQRRSATPATATDPEDGTLPGKRFHVARRLPPRHALPSVRAR